MSIVNIDPKSGDFPYLHNGGKYGPGMENDAKVVVSAFVADCEAGSKNAPAYDRDCDRGPYALLTFQVTESDQVVYVRHHDTKKANTGSRTLRFLESMGVPVDDAGNFDDEQVVGRECILEVGPSTVGKDGKPYSGRVKDVIGIS